MAAIIRLLVVLALAWVAYTYGWPRVKLFLDDPKVVTTTRGGGDGIGCVQSGRRALETFENGIGEFNRPPLDTEKWAAFRARVQARQDTAAGACSCAAEPCGIAREALDRFDSLMRLYDNELRRGSYPSSAAADISDIHQLFDRARDAIL